MLYLVHRIPFPPNKGDKIRSYHLLRFLASRYRVHLGTLVDSPEDEQYISSLDELCASRCVEPLHPRSARLRSMAGFVTGEALTVRYYRNDRLRAWVEHTVRDSAVRKAVVFSATMAQFLRRTNELRLVLDFVDVDSAKWSQYGEQRAWPSSLIYRREGLRLHAFEREVAARAAANVFVTRAEADLFIRMAPEYADKTYAIQNGVDSEYFAPRPDLSSPYAKDEEAILFTGAMDYWPNVDAVSWFAREVMPRVSLRRPSARFYIVGMNPSSSVSALTTDPRVVVTGRVPDVRPYLQHAAAVVAPLRVARGIQNKVLEAMAMARPVVVSSCAAGGISGVPGRDFEKASDAPAFAERVIAVMNSAKGKDIGNHARTLILDAYDWTRSLAQFGSLLDDDKRQSLR